MYVCLLALIYCLFQNGLHCAQILCVCDRILATLLTIDYNFIIENGFIVVYQYHLCHKFHSETKHLIEK